MKRSVQFFTLLVLFVSLVASAQQQKNDQAREYVKKAAEVMGGESALRNIKTARITSVGHKYFLEQSERPDGPFIVAYETRNASYDFEHGKVLQEIEQKSLGQEGGSKTSVTMADNVAQFNLGDKHIPGSPSQVDDLQELLEFSALRLVVSALDAKDLRSLPDASFHGEPYHVVTFTHVNLPVKLYLNAYTGLPGVAEWIRAYPTSVFWRVWGDVRNRQEFTAYYLLPGGLRLPFQTDLSRNEQAYSSDIVFKIDLNPTFAPDTFTIASDVASAYEQRKAAAVDAPPIGKPLQVVEGDNSLVLFRGAWNATLIQQPDGLVILEAPIGPGHTRSLLAEAKQRFPNVPIKSVITTSDSWPHFGGLREMVANGIPVYATDLNQPILTRFINASFKLAPDSLSKSPKPAKFHWVSAKTVIGTGPNRLEVYPLRNASGERYLMVYFPERKILYVSDLAQHMPDGNYFMPEYLKEISDAAAREHLTVEKFFAMHMPVTPWSDLQEGIARATAQPKTVADGEK